MLWKLAGFLAHSPYAECCSWMSDFETYVRTHDETDLAKFFWNSKEGENVELQKEFCQQLTWPRKNNIQSFLLSSQISFEAAREHKRYGMKDFSSYLL